LKSKLKNSAEILKVLGGLEKRKVKITGKQ
jgi:hypothetical protein